jgi:hypothetical protein
MKKNQVTPMFEKTKKKLKPGLWVIDLTGFDKFN